MPHAPKAGEDHSVQQRPITLGVQGVQQIIRCMNDGSREVKDVLLNECSVLFECKVCRSIFRSLANLLAHKRIYCSKHLCEEMPLSTLSALSEEPTLPSPTGELQLTPTADTASAMYQRVRREDEQPPQDKKPSSSQATSSQTRYLSVRSDCDLSQLLCLNCDTMYTSVTMLYVHMVSLHSTRRRYYRCPLCRASFVELWEVTRHLISVHSQTKKQIVQLRDSIHGGIQLRKSRLQHIVDCLQRNSSTAAVCSQCSRLPATYPCHRADRLAKKARRKGVPRRRPLVSNPDGASGSGAKRTVQLHSANMSPAMERKILAISNYDRLACLRCKRIFSSFSSLRRHAAVHSGRFRCTRCIYQSYNRADCRSHVQRMHADTAHNAERMIVHMPGKEEGGHRMATRRLSSLSSLVTRSGAYAKSTV
ncbi:zinc finger protein 800 [Dermacentor silvarum]|uniref:zinc finger protein 800 n=1 Tax=Dermacentor silvarum TaxID=543639 RepID=UPI00189A5539|nr:zinc finger protein 800 [Dermacentor silvarum]